MKMFNKIGFFLFVSFVVTLMACGPSKEDIEKEIEREDSLMEPERDSAIESANDFIMNTDSLNQDSLAENDSI